MQEPIVVTAYQQKSDGTLATIIPKGIREHLGISKGARFMVYLDDDSKMIFKLINDISKKSAQNTT